MSLEKKIGLTTTHLNLCKLAIGMGRPGMYWEFGLQNNALLKMNLPESKFRPEFLEACSKGLLVWADDRQGRVHFKLRKYNIADRGWLAVVDEAILGGEDYNYYKTFDGTEAGLKKVQKGSKDVEIKFKGRKQGISIKELFRSAPKSVQEKIKAANPKWQSMLV
jgi:hypothetical protein